MATFRDVIFKISLETGDTTKDIRALTRQIDRLEKEIEQAEEGTLEYIEAQKKLALINRQLAQSAGRYTQQQRRVQAAQARTTRATNQLTQGFTSFRGAVQAFLALAVVQQFISLSKAGLQSAGALEQNTIALSTFLNSAVKAQIILQDLQRFANLTPFDTAEVIKAGKLLIGVGVSANEIGEIIQNVGNVVAGVGGNLNDVLLVLTQVKTANRLYTQDLLQFTSRGIPIIAQLAKQFNVTEAEVRKLVETGKVGFNDVLKVFKNLSSEGGQFAGLLEKQSESLIGLGSTLSSVWASFLGNLAENSGLVKGAKAGLKGIITTVQELNKELTPESLQRINAEIEKLRSLAPSRDIEQLTNSQQELKVALDQVTTEINKQVEASLQSISDESERQKAIIKTIDLIKQQSDIENERLDFAIKEISNQQNLGEILLKQIEEEDIARTGAQRREEARRRGLEIAEKERTRRFLQTQLEVLELELQAREKSAKQQEQTTADTNKKNLKLNLEFQSLILQNEIKTANAVISSQEETKNARLDAVDLVEQKLIELSNIRTQLANFGEREALKIRNNRAKQEAILQDELIRLNERRIKVISDAEKMAFRDLEVSSDILQDSLKDANEILFDELFGDTGEEIEAFGTKLQEQLAKVNESLASSSDIAFEQFKLNFQELQPIIQEFASLATQAVNSVFDLQEQRLDRQITQQQDRLRQAEALAEKGNTTVLKLERERLAELERRREAAARRDNAITAIQTSAQIGLAIARTAAETGVLSVGAIPIILGAIGAGISLIPSLVGNVGFYDGGLTGSGKDTDIKGVVHANEQVINARQLRDKAIQPYASAIEHHRKTGVFIPPMPQQTQPQNIKIEVLENQMKEMNNKFDALLSQRANFSVTQYGIKHAYDQINTRVNKLNSKR